MKTVPVFIGFSGFGAPVCIIKRDRVFGKGKGGTWYNPGTMHPLKSIENSTQRQPARTTAVFIRRAGSGLKHRLPEIALLLAYCAVIVWLSSRHEIWRDEMRALSLVLESRSPWDLLGRLSAEGHPFLWYLILYLAHALIRHTVALKIAGLAVAAGAAAVLLFRAPFSLPQKALFLCGLFPIYEYSVKARNYGISMLLLFGLCALYRERFKNILWLGLLVFLLAQTNVHSLIIAAALLFSLGGEYLCRRARGLRDPAPGLSAAGFGLMLAGILFSAWQIHPDSASFAAPSLRSMDWAAVIRDGLKGWEDPGRYFHEAFGLGTSSWSSVVIWCGLLFFVRRPFIFIVPFLTMGALGALFGKIYPGFLRHQGFMVLLLWCAFWMADVFNAGPAASPRARLVRTAAACYLYLFLLLEIAAAVPPVRADISRDYSASRAFGTALRRTPALREAIVVGEPDFVLESLPYYADNPTYFPRERRFGRVVRFTRENRPVLTLAELQQEACRIKAVYRKPVLIALGHPLEPQGAHVFTYAMGKKFEYDPAAQEQFIRGTRRLFDFTHALEGEKYSVFEVK